MNKNKMCENYLLIITIASLILESFPISSSGHIELLNRLFLNYNCRGILPEDFDHFLHLPTAFVLAIFFYNRWRPLLALRKSFWIIIKMLWLGIITDGITVIGYLLFYKSHSFFLPLWVGFLITGLLLLSLRFIAEPQQSTRWNVNNALVLGLIQAASLMPGISRFGSTFVGARLLGFSSRKAFELSFLLEWPISMAAGFKGLYSLIKHNELMQILNYPMMIGIIIASIGALAGLYAVQLIIKKNRLWVGAFYLFIMALIAAQ